MLKVEVIGRIVSTGLVAVIRAETPDQAMRIVDACAAGGVVAFEITFTVPGARDVIAALCRRDDDLLVGAGTVIDSETARVAHLEGARFIVGPSFEARTARLANRYAIPYIPGAGTVTEVVHAMEAGVDIVKVFPGETLGPEFVRAVGGPLPQASLMPTGGVSVENVGDWIRAGAVAVGAGSQLTGGASSGNYARVTETARRFIQAIGDARA